MAGLEQRNHRCAFSQSELDHGIVGHHGADSSTTGQRHFDVVTWEFTPPLAMALTVPLNTLRALMVMVGFLL